MFQNRRFPGIVQTKKKKLQVFATIRLQLSQQREQTLQKLPLAMWVQMSNDCDNNELTILGENNESILQTLDDCVATEVRLLSVTSCHGCNEPNIQRLQPKRILLFV